MNILEKSLQFSHFPLWLFPNWFFPNEIAYWIWLTFMNNIVIPQNHLDELHSASSSPALSWVRLKCWKSVIKLNHCTMMEMFLASGDSVDIANKCFKLDALSLKPPLTLISIWYIFSSIFFFPKYPIQSNRNLCLTSVHFGSGPNLLLPFGKTERQYENSVNFLFFSLALSFFCFFLMKLNNFFSKSALFLFHMFPAYVNTFSLFINSLTNVFRPPSHCSFFSSRF